MNKTIILNITEDMNGKEIKEILSSYLKLSKEIIKQLKTKDDGILLNGEKAYVIKRVSTSDNLTVNIREKFMDNIPPSDIPIDILYEDEDILAVNKPRSMPTHPSLNHYTDTLANGVMYYYKDLPFTFRAITRLDRDTSGVVLIAKNILSAHLLGVEMKYKRIKKNYIAVVNGKLKDKEGIISAPIKRAKEGIMLRCVAPDGKEAVTEYKVISEGENLSLVTLSPLTGRTHQLRVHMSHIGHPIYGDDLYGAPQKNERLRLHCREITFIHPFLKREIKIEAPLPEDISNLQF